MVSGGALEPGDSPPPPNLLRTACGSPARLAYHAHHFHYIHSPTTPHIPTRIPATPTAADAGSVVLNGHTKERMSLVRDLEVLLTLRRTRIDAFDTARCSFKVEVRMPTYCQRTTYVLHVYCMLGWDGRHSSAPVTLMYVCMCV